MEKIKHTLSIIILAILPFAEVFGQADTLLKQPKDFYHALRFGAGWEESQYVEMGYSKLILHDKGAEDLATSYCFYATGQLSFKHSDGGTQNLYGLKVGFESTIMWRVIWGGEIKYLTTFKNDWQLYFTPKIGLSLSNVASIQYGFNMPKQDNLDEVGRHQVSLTINISKRLFRDYL